MSLCPTKRRPSSANSLLSTRGVCNVAAQDSFNVAILATDGFEESELTEPAKALGQAGAKVGVISLHEGRIQAFKHFDRSVTVPIFRSLRERGVRIIARNAQESRIGRAWGGREL